MKCTKCGKEIDNDSKFCDGCGETVIAETPAAPKKKVSKKLIAIICCFDIVKNRMTERTF